MNAFQLTPTDAPECKALAKLRDNIRAVCAAIKEVESADAPAEEILARLKKAIGDSVFNYTPGNDFEQFANSNHAILPVEINFATLAWLLGPENLADQIVKRLGERNRQVGLPRPKRAAKLVELDAQLDDLEIHEEIEILRLQKAGVTVLRRPDVRPDLVSKIWEETA